MKHFILWCVVLCSSQACLALEPYVQGDKVPGPDLSAQLDQVDRKLQAAGFTVVGRHTPPGLPGHASLVVTDPDMLAAVRSLGGPAIVAAAIRVGLQSDGTLSYMNPEYWYRAYLRGQYPAAQAAAQSVQLRLARTLGAGPGFGGNVPDGDLANYRYMFGMERFDSANSLLATHASFEEALKAVQDNLSQGVGATRRVYEVVMPGNKTAVFGVAMNDPGDGEGWWVNKIGAGHMAGLPYEVFIVDNKVYALYARYRIALAWPALGMGQFMRIVNAPEAIRNTLTRVAGGTAH
ncbi:MAG TPA: hypothetical protein DCY64_08145 [Hydrogenophaga sp.]|jgi:hypothetical protein|uniref:hypothetical protein n=1 Tax=Hydrogenophaga sp. TaxID=1904254 RepID=UPI0008B16F34|nr:hypothetical protein [Hydrogenophaga sp.]OGA75536.1 MAG: hypothetical protein A2X73_04075 [Burkholderiales bacterium GWE1_65_30]OGA93662.1 MAG: hypothetical protein A2X72_21645 [Burkholderiales bacterium GWF1_66_17]PKO74271.1 MAG: hypothetical protein CVU21_24275 [Betaproteobacteria bacterium HGW-Betaproteobacteria-15]MDO9029442.1 hypothetical protein [Hydrogenophaga sp.]MDZ4290852.1 hypothetical protein [Hydrogenophaga sp.]